MSTERLIDELTKEKEELKRKVEALAGENAEMKRLASEAYDEMESHYDTDGLHSVDADGEQMDALIRLCDAQSTCEKLGLMETPATDAALAEIRAQGVEMLIAMKLNQLENMHPDTHGFGAQAMEIRTQVNEMMAFANQLRKESGQ